MLELELSPLLRVCQQSYKGSGLSREMGYWVLFAVDKYFRDSQVILPRFEVDYSSI